MIALILFGGLIAYLAAFMAMARALAARDHRQGRDADNYLGVALLWPLTGPVLLVVVLYELAVRDAGVSRAERRRRKLAQSRQEIAGLERDLGMGEE